MQFLEHFDLAEECSALELVPAPWQTETLHFRNGILLLEQELCSLVLCSLPSLSYYKNVPVCGLLALTETP